MTPTEWMKRTYELYQYKTVRVISIPLPPIHVKGLIYRPDSFASKTFDNVFDTYGSKYRSASVTHTPFGPAVLMTLPLEELIGYDQNTGFLTVHRASCCATVTYSLKMGLKENGEKYDFAWNVVLDGLSFAGRSCNPGSHTLVPRAPHLTALIQYANAPEGYGFGVQTFQQYLEPEMGERLFPEWNFDGNAAIDAWIAKCTVDNNVRLKENTVGIGLWAIPFLRQLRINKLLMEESNYGTGIVDHPSQEDGRGVGSSPDRGRVDPAVRGQGRADPDRDGPQDHGSGPGVAEGPGVRHEAYAEAQDAGATAGAGSGRQAPAEARSAS